MTNTIVNVTQVRDNLSEILGRVKFGDEVVTIEKKGKPYAVIMSPEQYEAFQKIAKDRLFVLADKIQSRNINFNEDEVLNDITEAVKNVRQKAYGKSK